jgi:hypothetical protein
MIDSIAGIKRNKGMILLAELLPGAGLLLCAGPLAVVLWALRRGDRSTMWEV